MSHRAPLLGNGRVSLGMQKSKGNALLFKQKGLFFLVLLKQ